MHRHSVHAIYEGGVLKPLEPLDLKEHQRVSLSIAANGEDGITEAGADDYASFVAEDGDPSVTWEQVQILLARLPDDLSADFDRERDERP